jgi:hypothetical protein
LVVLLLLDMMVVGQEDGGGSTALQGLMVLYQGTPACRHRQHHEALCGHVVLQMSNVQYLISNVVQTCCTG